MPVLAKVKVMCETPLPPAGSGFGRSTLRIDAVMTVACAAFAPKITTLNAITTPRRRLMPTVRLALTTAAGKEPPPKRVFIVPPAR
jgi:hypothetical protein